MSAPRARVLVAVAALAGAFAARCDFGIDTRGLADGQAPIDGASETAPPTDASQDVAPPADAGEAGAVDSGDAGSGDSSADAATD